jgi:hypothetical protein
LVADEAVGTQGQLNQEQLEAVAVVQDTAVLVVQEQQAKATQEQELQIGLSVVLAVVLAAPQLQGLAAKVIPKVKAI